MQATFSGTGWKGNKQKRGRALVPSRKTGVVQWAKPKFLVSCPILKEEEEEMIFFMYVAHF